MPMRVGNAVLAYAAISWRLRRTLEVCGTSGVEFLVHKLTGCDKILPAFIPHFSKVDKCSDRDMESCIRNGEGMHFDRNQPQDSRLFVCLGE